MKHLGLLGLALGLALACAAVGCKTSGDSAPSSNSETVLEALTRAMRWQDGVRRSGDIEELDPAAETVELSSADQVLSIAPGTASIMALELDNPTDDPVVATLMQLEGSDSHTEVPTGKNASEADGGTGSDAGAGAGSALRIENAFEVDDDICDHLCPRRYTARLAFAVQLKGGAVSKQGTLEIALDCTKKGNPDACEDDSNGGGKDSGSTGSSGNSGGKDASAGERDGGSGTPSMDGGKPSPDGGARDASVGNDGAVSSSGLPPQIGPITPGTATAGTAVTLTIAGSGFLDSASAFVDGVSVPTTVMSDALLEAAVPAARTGNAGSLAVYVENVRGDASTRSNVLYLQVTAAAGAPTVYDYSPDNGVAGDKILIIASNLAGQTLTITDANGTTLTPGTLSTIAWPTAGTVDTVEVTLPDNIATGPITVGNPLGSYQGKIFSVGLNLTRADGTVLDSSTEYNTGNWSRASGGDNLLATSFFTAHGDCATATTCTTKPFFQITFASAQTIGRIAIRGNREYASGYDFIRGDFEVLGESGSVLWSGTYDLPAPDRDLDITLPDAVSGAISVKFTSIVDESDEPGLSELEVFGP